MTTPTYTIGMDDVNIELGYSASRIIRLGDSAVRNLAGDTSGAISMSSLRGKSLGVPVDVTVGRAILNATEKSPGSENRGLMFTPTVQGSVSPSSVGGQPIAGLYFGASSIDGYNMKSFYVTIGTESLSQNWFDAVDIENFGVLYTANATSFYNSGDYSGWTWGSVTTAWPWSLNEIRTVSFRGL